MAGKETFALLFSVRSRRVLRREALMKKAILILVAFLFLGCSKTVWKHYSHNNVNQFNRDKADCLYQSHRDAKIAYPYRYKPDETRWEAFTRGFTLGFRQGMHQGELFMLCMEARGYYRVAVKDAEFQKMSPADGDTAGDESP